ncbi:MAG: hypothetical protein N2Z21_04470 [Candidatus Sumerlaeaceae bacterium]|nr:hypothetical protein [Candidatus Sumerlaeaceae bacterium]
MEINRDRARYLQYEFECFVRIGLDERARREAIEKIETYFFGSSTTPIPTFRFEISDASGQIHRIIEFEPDERQLVRLHEFLNRWTIAEVREMVSLLPPDDEEKAP